MRGRRGRRRRFYQGQFSCWGLLFRRRRGHDERGWSRHGGIRLGMWWRGRRRHNTTGHLHTRTHWHTHRHTHTTTNERARKGSSSTSSTNRDKRTRLCKGEMLLLLLLLLLEWESSWLREHIALLLLLLLEGAYLRDKTWLRKRVTLGQTRRLGRYEREGAVGRDGIRVIRDVGRHGERGHSLAGGTNYHHLMLSLRRVIFYNTWHVQ